MKDGTSATLTKARTLRWGARSGTTRVWLREMSRSRGISGTMNRTVLLSGEQASWLVAIFSSVHLNIAQRGVPACRICVPDTQENVDLTNYGGLQDGTRIAIWGRWEPGENQTWFFEKGASE